MSVSHTNRTTLNRRFLFLTVIGILFLLPSIFFAGEVADSGIVQYNRADVGTIKTLTHQILSTKDYAPRKTFQQWLFEKFDKWKWPKLDIGDGWTAFICKIIILWCILTLIAILIHLIWTIYTLIRSHAKPSISKRNIGFESSKVIPFEEMYKMSQEFAKNGAFHEAISMITLTLLCWLDLMNIVYFHESKTNGDYIREYPTGYAGRDEFRKFILISEQTIYGGLHSSNQMYSQMNFLMKHIQNCVTQKEQN